MERFCAVFSIAPGSEEEFRVRHVEIWPEMREGMKAAGFANYTLFRRGTQVVSYGECHPDAATCFARFGELPVAARWNESMAEMVVDIVDDEGNLYRYDEVWHLE
jgi:L-rhamnose mutarotase